MMSVTIMLDKVANSLESKGYTRQAESLDVISNTLDRVAALSQGKSDALGVGIAPIVWANLLEPEKLYFNKWVSGGTNKETIRRVIDPVEEAKALATYDYVRDLKDPSLSSLETKIDEVRKRSESDLSSVLKGLNIIPELVKWLKETHSKKVESYLKDDKFVQRAISELER